jgi:hypothetical protein
MQRPTLLDMFGLRPLKEEIGVTQKPVNIAPAITKIGTVCDPSKTETLVMTHPNSEQIITELQRFAQSQQDAAETRYHLQRYHLQRCLKTWQRVS